MKKYKKCKKLYFIGVIILRYYLLQKKIPKIIKDVLCLCVLHSKYFQSFLFFRNKFIQLFVFSPKSVTHVQLIYIHKLNTLDKECSNLGNCCI